MKLKQLLEDTTTGSTAGGSFIKPLGGDDGDTVVVKRTPMTRLKGQFVKYGLGERCHGCDLIKTKYETLGSRRSPKLITCQMCGKEHKAT